MEPGEGRIPLFMPTVPTGALDAVANVLQSRWIGQGPRVDEFEGRFSKAFADGRASLAVGSGTDALHLAYLLAGIGPEDEVITPVFTCTATNIPLLYLGAKPVFADINPTTLNIDPESIKQKLTARTKAIVVVHYGGLPCDMDQIREVAKAADVPVIEDAAHAVGASYRGVSVGALSEFTAFSFQAIKQITTGDGGMLTLSDRSLAERARRLRWFGIDRTKKQLGIWENDISDIGYKYQMTDIAAALGLAALNEWQSTFKKRKSLQDIYFSELVSTPGIRLIGTPRSDRVHAAWLMTVAVESRRDLQRKLLERGVETNQVHYRNDRYSIFGGRQGDLEGMDSVEDDYLVLPLNTHMRKSDVRRVCEVIKQGW